VYYGSSGTPRVLFLFESLKLNFSELASVWRDWSNLMILFWEKEFASPEVLCKALKVSYCGNKTALDSS
jgi:hypothetical protein